MKTAHLGQERGHHVVGDVAADPAAPATEERLGLVDEQQGRVVVLGEVSLTPDEARPQGFLRGADEFLQQLRTLDVDETAV